VTKPDLRNVSIKVGFTASDGTATVGMENDYHVGIDVGVSESTTADFERLGMKNSRKVSGSGDAYLYQRLWGAGGGDDWTADHLLATAGSSRLVDVSAATLKPTACDMVRTTSVDGTASVCRPGA